MTIGDLKSYAYLFKKILTIPIRGINFLSFKNAPDFEGKFFRVTFKNKNKCLKRIIKNEHADIILDLANVVVVTVLLEEKNLTPNVYSIYIDAPSNYFAICVGKAEDILINTEKYRSGFSHFSSCIADLAEKWKIRRLPYDDYPYDNTFLLEIKNKSNLGIFLGKIVLLDIDPKCYSNNKLIKFAALIFKNRIYRNLNKFKK
ncbi:MAG: hypothetical protein V1696_01755 [Candidatus Jorgensenbacteria bacterium]